MTDRSANNLVITPDSSLREVSRLLTEIENNEALCLELLRKGSPRCRCIGITGPPGAGKSQLIDALIERLLQRTAGRVGVVAVDPSSPRHGGALLGDRVRMMRHADNPRVLLRSMATRGCLGGVAKATQAFAVAMAYWGCDPVLIETVGVGQSEVAVTSIAGRTVLLLPPGSGDVVQLLKSGVLEMSDIIAVGKADMPEAEAFFGQVTEALHLQGRSIPVLQVSAVDGRGVEELLEHL